MVPAGGIRAPPGTCSSLFYTEQKHKEIDAVVTYTCFGINLVEISPAGAFLRQVFMGGVNMKNSNLDPLFCQV